MTLDELIAVIVEKTPRSANKMPAESEMLMGINDVPEGQPQFTFAELAALDVGLEAIALERLTYPERFTGEVGEALFQSAKGAHEKLQAFRTTLLELARRPVQGAC